MTAVDPALEIVRAMRGALAMFGLERRELDGSVYWIGGGQAPSPVLVLLHGTNDQAGTWARIIPLLINRYRLILPDLAGHGESEPKTGPIAISVVVDRLRRIIDHERVNDITLGGNSFGAWIALLYTLAHPEKVKRLVLESGGGLARPLGVPLVARDRETAMTILRGVHGPSYVPEEWVIDTLLARATDSPLLRLEGAMESFVDARLSQLDKPATLIWGADDGVVPVSYGEALQKLIRGATLHVIDGAAHIPHLQQPERFVECLTATS
jgi:pimeloyl-ACP methyl ester carboxylesterase